MKQYTKPFVVVVAVAAVFMLALSLSSCSGDFSDNGVLLTVWAGVITIVFLVFSVLGLLNIDGRIKELNETKIRLEDAIRKTEEKTETTIRSVEDKVRDFEKSASDRESEIKKAAHDEITRMLNKSISLQNLYEQLSRENNEYNPQIRIVGFTDFLQAHSNAEGVNYSYIYICRGDAYCELGLFEKGLADYKEALRISPKDVSSLSSLATFYANQKDYDKSIDYFKEALAINPNQVSLHLDIANSYSAKGDFKEAEKHYSKASDLSVESADYYYNKARKMSDEGSDTDGYVREKYLKHCLTLNPAYYRARINLAAVYRERGDEVSATKELNEVISSGLNEDYVMAVLQRGISYRLMKDFATALIDFEIVHHFRPLNVQNLSNLAMTHLALGHILEAEQFARKGLKLGAEQNFHDCDTELSNVIAEIERRKFLIYQRQSKIVNQKSNNE